MVVVEAFSAGVPCVVSGLGSLAEMVEDGVTGLHCRPGDAEDLAAKAAWMADHPAGRAAMANAARARYDEQYTPERNYALLMDIYQAAISYRRVAGI